MQITKLDLVVSDKIRTECPVYENGKLLRWGMARSRLAEDELVVYVWGRDEVLAQQGAGREMAEYVTGCLKQMIKEGEIVRDEAPLTLSPWERLMTAPVTIRYKE